MMPEQNENNSVETEASKHLKAECRDTEMDRNGYEHIEKAEAKADQATRLQQQNIKHSLGQDT